LWTELKAKRERLPSLHQEFDVSQTFKAVSGNQSSQWQIVLDMSQGKWREESVNGSGDHLNIFDGKDLFRIEEGGDEFLRTKRRPKDADPAPSPYSSGDPDWSKAVELERLPCGISGSDHLCVVLEAPLRNWTRPPSPSSRSIRAGGSARMLLDTETGLVVFLRTSEVIENQRGRYLSEVTYRLKRLSHGARADANLFVFSSNDMREVKELSPWNAAKIKKQLTGKPAPELAVTDIQGKPVTLSAMKGKTVLLDFWTTWCHPCRADGPALERLYRKYGGQELMIVGISVSEERASVEKFLKQNPHTFPVVLTAENEIPRPYQIGVFPTYIVIDRDGKVGSVVEGDRGFADLRKLLLKAGLEAE
jgi:thiol-disulfide isomerase/thioredoxin